MCALCEFASGCIQIPTTTTSGQEQSLAQAHMQKFYMSTECTVPYLKQADYFPSSRRHVNFFGCRSNQEIWFKPILVGLSRLSTGRLENTARLPEAELCVCKMPVDKMHTDGHTHASMLSN